MGYSYDRRGHLCCDGCSAADGVRRVKCPYNYCPAPAFCANCRKRYRDRLTREAHADCARGAAKVAERDARQAAILAGGGAVRCSARSVDDSRVHVLFRLADGSTVGHYMAPDTYRAAPLLEPMTPEDFAAKGALEPAPATFY